MDISNADYQQLREHTTLLNRNTRFLEKLVNKLFDHCPAVTSPDNVIFSKVFDKIVESSTDPKDTYTIVANIILTKNPRWPNNLMSQSDR